MHYIIIKKFFLKLKFFLTTNFHYFQLNLDLQNLNYLI